MELKNKPHQLAAHAASCVAERLPPILYQTYIVNGQQDSSTLFEMNIKLSDFMFATLSGVATLCDAVSVSIRRFDGRALEVFKNGSLQVLKLSQDMFGFELNESEHKLVVSIHRKHLPVSSSHSDFPFKLVFVLGVGPRFEVVPTNAFHIGSKQPQGTTKRAPPKRARPPPSKIPFAAPADELDALIEGALFPVAPADPKPAPARGVKRPRGDDSPCSAAGSSSEEPAGVSADCTSPAAVPEPLGASSPKRPRAASHAEAEAEEAVSLPVPVLRVTAPPALSIRLPMPPPAMDRELSAPALDVPEALPVLGSAGSLSGGGSFSWADAAGAGRMGGTPSAFLRTCSPAATL